MSTIIVIAVVAALVAAGVFALSERKPAGGGTRPASAPAGRSPHPRIDMMDVAGQLRFVDLRHLPVADLVSGRGLVLATEALRTEPPLGPHVWVLPSEVVRTWCTFEPFVLDILASRLGGAHKVPGPDLILAPDHEWNDADMARMLAANLNVLVPSKDPDRAAAAEQALAALATCPRESGLERPVLGCTQHGSQFLRQDLVWEIDAFVVIDFRRAVPAAIENLAAFSFVEQPLASLDSPRQFAVWIVAPWVLALWRARQGEVISKIRALQASLPRTTEHRLVVYGGEGDPALVKALSELGMHPLTETLHAKTESGDTFEIPVLELLRDCTMQMAVRSENPTASGRPG